jgi:hypothetical protein
MSAKKKRQDALKAKEKKQKVIAAVGGVLLVGLLAFQVPRVMKQLNRGKGGPPPVPQAVSTTPTGTTPSLEAPTTMQDGSTSGATSGASTSGSGSSASGLITSSTGAATSGELASFSRFESKDPFAQQVQDTGSSTSPSSSSSSSSGSGSSGSGTSGGTGGSSSGSGSTGGSQPAPGSAVISVNGTLMSVTVGSDFPQASTSNPSATALFHLVSLTTTTAKIAIAGGSYTSGAPTVTLHVNKPVTLMNTADGSRFKLILKPQGTAVPGAAGSTSTTPTVTVPAPSP